MTIFMSGKTMHRISYKFELRPSSSQLRQFAVFAGQTRFVFNELLRRSKAKHEAGEKQSLTPIGLSYEVTKLKEEFEWLGECDRHALNQSARRLALAYKRWFAWCKKKIGPRVGAPRFKRKHGIQSFTFDSNLKVRGNEIWLPKIGWVRFHKSRDVIGKIKTVAVRRSTTGKWCVSIACEREFELLPTCGSIVGVDMGLSSYVTFSTGVKVDNPRWFRRSERKLAKLQRSLCRKVKGSNNRHKARLKVAKIHEHIANQRRDFQHKLSTKLVNENQVIGVESLSLVGLVRTRLSKSFSDAGISQFLGMLKYKCEWYGRTLVEADRFYPSSKKCSVCGNVNSELSLSDRSWVCVCGVSHDRDVNAAINLRNVAAGYAETQNACGDGVRQGVIHAII